MINLFVKIRYQNLSFDLNDFIHLFFKDKQMNHKYTIIKTKTMFKEVIDDFNKLHRDDICNTMKEMINIVMKE